MAAYLIVAVFLILSLTGCGVHFEVSTPTAPTPTPRIFPGVDYSLGGVWRVQAKPRVVFPTGENAQVNLFLNSTQLPVLLLQDRQLYVVADYDVTWFAAPQSNAQVRVRVFTRYSDEDTWEPYDTAERDLRTTSAPDTTRDSLYIMMVFGEPTALQVRAEISVIAYDADGSIITNVDATEFPVLVLNDTGGDIEVNTDLLYPQFGDWNENQMVFDWRDWHGGPCGLTGWDLEAIYAACDALNNGDGDALYTSMLEAVEAAEPSELRGALNGQWGLMLVAAGKLDDAAGAFNQAVEAYGETLAPFEVGVHLHNMAAAHIMRDDPEAAYSTLEVLQELRSQFYDEAGNMLTQAIAGYYSQEWWRLDDPQYWFGERGLPQADIFELWRLQADQ